jgi:hypothetical protein
MQPNIKLITIGNNQNLIIEFLNDLIIKPRLDIHKWSKITKQTPTLKIGYIGQHLTSLILGMEGGRTGARGHDIIDGTEVKSCTKVDQADKCKDCGGRVMRTEETCPHCDGNKIDRKDDSKWLFSIRTEDELNQLTSEIDRIFLLISDYPNFKDRDFSSIRFEGFEIYPNNPRMSVFNLLLSDYYRNNYRPKADANQTTSPMNFHPYKIQFYMCNPIKVFSCNIENIDTNNPSITINKFIEPSIDRSNLLSEDMPVEILSKNELLDFCNSTPYEILLPLLINKQVTKNELIEKVKGTKQSKWHEILPYINEEGKKYLRPREIIIGSNSAIYKRN